MPLITQMLIIIKLRELKFQVARSWIILLASMVDREILIVWASTVQLPT
jgi:hypothetical protein